MRFSVGNTTVNILALTADPRSTEPRCVYWC